MVFVGYRALDDRTAERYLAGLGALRYYNTAIHRAAFALPQFVRELVAPQQRSPGPSQRGLAALGKIPAGGVPVRTNLRANQATFEPAYGGPSYSPYGTQMFLTWVARRRYSRPCPCSASNQSRRLP